MTSAGEATPNVANDGKPVEDSVAAQLMGMAAALWQSRQRAMVAMLLLALVAVVSATAYAQIRLNGHCGDAISNPQTHR